MVMHQQAKSASAAWVRGQEPSMHRGLPNVSTRVSAAVAVAAAVEALDRENHSDAALARADDTYLQRAQGAHCTDN
jgi:hypothetical protein